MILEGLIRKEWGPIERKALWEDILHNDMINVLYEGVSTFQPLLFDQWTKYTQHNEPHSTADGSVVVQPMIQINLSDISSVTLEYIEMKLLSLKQSKLLSSSSSISPSSSSSSIPSSSSMATSYVQQPSTIELPSLITSQTSQQPLQTQSSQSSTLSSLVSPSSSTTTAASAGIVPSSISNQIPIGMGVTTPAVASSLLPSLASAIGISNPMTINATPTLEGTCLPLITITGVDSTKRLDRDNSFILSSNRAINPTSKTSYNYNPENTFDSSLLNPFWLANNNNNCLPAAAAAACCCPPDDHPPRTPQSPLSPSSWNPSGMDSPLSHSSSVSPMSKTAFYTTSAGTTTTLPASAMMPGNTRMNDTEYISQALDKQRISLANTLPIASSSSLSGTIENNSTIATKTAAAVGTSSGESPNVDLDEEFQITLVVYDSRKRDDSIKPFECSFPGCRKRFSDRSNLMTHIRKHTQEKPFLCRVCGRGFSHKSTLRDHEHAHTGEQPYRCEKCGKCFSQKSNLQRHTKIHTGKMPYKCPLCNKTFNQSSNLKTHINAKHHNNNNSNNNSVSNGVVGNGIAINGIHNNIIISNANINSFGIENTSFNSLNSSSLSSSSSSSSSSSPVSHFPLSQQQQQQKQLRSNLGMASIVGRNGMTVTPTSSSLFLSAAPQKGNGRSDFFQPFGLHKGNSVKNDDGFLPPITSVSVAPSSSSSSGTGISSALNSNLTSNSMIPSSSVNSPRSQSPPLNNNNKTAFTSISFLP